MVCKSESKLSKTDVVRSPGHLSYALPPAVYILFPTSPQGSSDLSHVSVLVFDRQPHIQFLEMVNTLSLIPSSIFALSIFHQANVSSHDSWMQRESGTDMHVTGPGDPVGPGGSPLKCTHWFRLSLPPSDALAQNDSLCM